MSAALVPRWLSCHVAWAYLTGVTFIAASVAVLVGVFAQLAAALSASQMGLFALLVWTPLIVRGPISAFQWCEVATNAALTAAAWVVTASYNGETWAAE